MITKFFQNKNNIFLLLILTVASFLRLYRIDVLMRFIWDEGRDMIAIRNIIVNQDLTLFGPFNEIGGSKDFFGVFHYYLMLPALWLSNFDPIGPAVFTAVLGIIAVGLTYFWAKKWMNQSSALMVAGFMAISPLVVKYTQWPWNPNTTGFFGVLYLLCLQAWQKKPGYVLSLTAGLLLGLLFQLHYFTVALGMAAVFVIWWQPKLQLKTRILHLLATATGFILPNLSFVVFDLTHQGFYRNILIESFTDSNPSQTYFILNPWQIITSPPLYLWEVTSGLVGNLWVGLLVAVLFTVWLIKIISTGIKRKKATPSWQLAVSWLFFLAIISVFPTLKNDYHSAALWLAFPIAVLDITKKWWSGWPQNTKKIVMGILIIMLVLSNKFWRAPGQYENMPLVRAAGEAIAADAKGEANINVASLVDSDTRAIRFRYFLIKNGATPQSVDSYPESEILYVISPHSWEESSQNPAWELESFVDSDALQIWQDQGWKVYKVVK